jgi:hypothetical protein
MAKQKQRTGKNEAVEVLDDICLRYPRIHPRNVERFAPVYYPIAMVEMELDEQTFEDFETVQLTILRLTALGIHDHHIIAQTLGLSPNYVYKVMRLLMGYGHIDEGGITALGRESLSREKKIVTTRTVQKFQVDGLNGTLLKVQHCVTEGMLNEKEETVYSISHLNYLDGMSADVLVQQLTGDTDGYLNQKSGILHTNVIRIHSARCTQIKYAKAYLLKLLDQPDPVVFAKRYDKNQKDMKDRFSWQPFSVHNARVISQLGFEPSTPISTAQALSYIRQLYSMMVEHSGKVELEEEVRKAVLRVYPFEEEYIRILPHSTSEGVIAVVSDAAVKQYRGWLVSFLLGIHRDGEYLVTNEHLYGHMISLRINGVKLKYLARLLTEAVEKRDRAEIFKLLREKFKDHNGETPLLEDMITLLRTLCRS